MATLRKASVVFVHPDLGIGGAERLVLDVAIALGKENNKVSFVTNYFNKNHAFEELKNNEFPVRVIGDWIPRSICGIFQACFAYIRMIYLALIYVLFMRNEEKPDLYFVDQIPMAVPFIKWTGGKVIYYCHHPDLLASPPGGTLKRIYRLPINWLELKGTSMADVILVNSKYTASVFYKTFPEITKDIQIVYPTVSSSYQATILKSKLFKSITDVVPEIQVSEGAFVFLSINRFHPAKKLELAIHAFEAAKSKLTPKHWNRVHLIMAGGYDPRSSVNAAYFSKLVKLCEKKNLTTKVTFLKSPDDDLKADLLLTCNCLIYTPVNEHFGIVPLEAMTAGKPVIACNSGGPCETILDDVTGYLCNPTSDSLSEAMFKILNNEKSLRMGLMGKERLEKYFSYEKFCSRVNEVVNVTLYGEGFLQKKKSLEKIVETKEDITTDSNESEVPNPSSTDAEVGTPDSATYSTADSSSTTSKESESFNFNCSASPTAHLSSIESERSESFNFNCSASPTVHLCSTESEKSESFNNSSTVLNESVEVADEIYE